MNQIQINVFKAEILKGVFEGSFDEIGSHVRAPQLTGDEEVLSFYHSFLDLRGYGLTDFLLVSVKMSAIDVPVADVDGILHGSGHLTWRRLKQNQ